MLRNLNGWLSKSSGPGDDEATKRKPISGLFGAKEQPRSAVPGAAASSSRLSMMKHLFPEESEQLLSRAISETTSVAHACEYVKERTGTRYVRQTNAQTNANETSPILRKPANKSQLLYHLLASNASKKNTASGYSRQIDPPAQRRILPINGLSPVRKTDSASNGKLKRPSIATRLSESESETEFEHGLAALANRKYENTSSTTTTEKKQAVRDDADEIVPSKKVKRTVLESPSPIQPASSKPKRRVVAFLNSDSDSDSDAGHKPVVNRASAKRRTSTDDDDDDIVGIGSEMIDCLNSASFGELVEIGRFKKAKAELLLGFRPFSANSFVDTLCQINAVSAASAGDSKATATSLRMDMDEIEERCKRILSVRRRLTEVMAKCDNVAASIRDTAAPDAVIRAPTLLVGSQSLKSYQLAGVNWLVGMHKSRASGAILGDEMGLGKTIQTISLLAFLLEHELNDNWLPHLIIVPSSTLSNWQHEIMTWCPSLRPTVYHGPLEERRVIARRLLNKAKRNGASKFHEDEDRVVLTTYAIACGKSRDDRTLLRKMQFNYVICDEGHLLKNMESKRYASLCRLNSRKRLLLTGTPMQNSLVELVSLLSFLEPTIFSEHIDTFNVFFRATRCSALTTGCAEQRDATPTAEQSVFETQRIAHAQRLLKPFILRRRKVDVLVDLPPKRTVIESVQLTERQSALYAAIRSEYVAEQANGSGGTRTSPLTIITQLRKVAQSALLIRSIYNEERLVTIAPRLSRAPAYAELTRDELLDELRASCDLEIHQLCRSYAPDQCLSDAELFENSSGKLQWLIAYLQRSQERILIFTQFLLILDLFELLLTSLDIPYVRLDGQTPVCERRALIDVFNGNSPDADSDVEIVDQSQTSDCGSMGTAKEDRPVRVFLLSTKAGGLGINLTAASTVILHDLDFNPYNDRQAEDRSHRLGQTRDVVVYRLLAAGTIDDAMQTIQNQKLQLDTEMQDSANDTFSPSQSQAQAPNECDDEDEEAQQKPEVDSGPALSASEATEVMRIALGLKP